MTQQRLPDLNALALADLFAVLDENGLIERLMELMRDEDLGPQRVDVTGRAARAVRETTAPALVTEVRTREGAVVCGLAVLPELLRVFGPDVGCETLADDGERVDPGDAVTRLEGPAEQMHALERPLLNILGRLSGVATRTSAFVRATRERNSNTQVLDTRKTTPGLRVLEKYAVRCGGGHCHRLGLHDAVLLKDNHLAGVPTDELAAFVAQVRTYASREQPLRFVEVEVDTLEQLDALLALDEGVVDVVLLDNMGPETLTRALAMRGATGARTPLFEASGGVTLETIGAIAATGVDRISVGAITHGATWSDFGLDAVDADQDDVSR